MRKVIESDSRNSGISVKAYIKSPLLPDILVYDIQSIESASRLDVFRVFMQFAQKIEDHQYDKVELACRGDTKFTLDGGNFNTIGKEYPWQNPVYTIRTFPYKLHSISGGYAYIEHTGNMFETLADQLSDFNDVHKKWYEYDLGIYHNSDTNKLSDNDNSTNTQYENDKARRQYEHNKEVDEAIDQARIDANKWKRLMNEQLGNIGGDDYSYPDYQGIPRLRSQPKPIIEESPYVIAQRLEKEAKIRLQERDQRLADKQHYKDDFEKAKRISGIRKDIEAEITTDYLRKKEAIKRDYDSKAINLTLYENKLKALDRERLYLMMNLDSTTMEKYNNLNR